MADIRPLFKTLVRCVGIVKQNKLCIRHTLQPGVGDREYKYSTTTYVRDNGLHCRLVFTIRNLACVNHHPY